MNGNHLKAVATLLLGVFLASQTVVIAEESNSERNAFRRGRRGQETQDWRSRRRPNRNRDGVEANNEDESPQPKRGLKALDFIKNELESYRESQQQHREEIRNTLRAAKEKAKDARRGRLTGDEEGQKAESEEAIRKTLEADIRKIVEKMVNEAISHHSRMASLLAENKEKAVNSYIDSARQRMERRRKRFTEGDRGPRGKRRNARKDPDDNDIGGEDTEF